MKPKMKSHWLQVLLVTGVLVSMLASACAPAAPATRTRRTPTYPAPGREPADHAASRAVPRHQLKAVRS